MHSIMIKPGKAEMQLLLAGLSYLVPVESEDVHSAASAASINYDCPLPPDDLRRAASGVGKYRPDRLPCMRLDLKAFLAWPVWLCLHAPAAAVQSTSRFQARPHTRQQVRETLCRQTRLIHHCFVESAPCCSNSAMCAAPHQPGEGAHRSR